MSLPYFPFYVADYVLDTQHLSLEEHGAYLRLLCLCWTTPGCTIPADPEWVRRRLGIDSETYERAVAPLLAEYFKRANGRLFSPRLLSIHEEITAAHTRRVEAGRKGGHSSKSRNVNGSGSSNAKAKPKQPEPEPELEEEGGKPPSSRRAATPRSPAKTRIPPDWQPSLEGLRYARDQGLPDDLIAEEVRGFVVYWTDRVRDSSKSEAGWDVTWRNRVRDVASRLPRRPPQQKGRVNGHAEGWAAAIHDARMADREGDDPPLPLLPARH